VLGARWKELSAEQRLPYEDLGKADRERYSDIVKLLGSLYVSVFLATDCIASFICFPYLSNTPIQIQL